MTSGYLPAECLEAVEATNKRVEDMKVIWDNYMSDLRNGLSNGNLAKIRHSMRHVQTVVGEHLEKHTALKNSASFT